MKPAFTEENRQKKYVSEERDGASPSRGSHLMALGSDIEWTEAT